MANPWEKDWTAPAATKKPWEKEWTAPQTNLVEQVGTGTSEGIANLAGLPVDALAGLWNIGAEHRGLPTIEKPFGGSESIQGLLDPFMSDVDPQTMAQRIGRRVGQDVGAGAVAAPVAGISSLGGMGLNVAADAASGLAGGATAEVTDNPIANVAASLAGGMVPIGGAYALRRPQAPSIDDLRAQEASLYRQVDESPLRLSPDQTQVLQGNISARMTDEGMYPPQHIGARGAVERVYELPNRHPEGTPSLGDVEDLRQYINQKVVPSTVAGEARLGRDMKNEIDAFLREAADTGGGAARSVHTSWGSAAGDVDAAELAHAISRRRMASQDVADVFQKAEWRAASTGTGGNDINAIRQNIRKLLEKEGGGFTPEQRAAMQQIVEGTPATNAARFVGGFAPQRGMIPGGAALGGAIMSGQSGNPLWVLPSGVGMVAQAIGETLTRKQVADLSAMIRSGQPINRALSDAERSVVNALVTIQAAQQQPQ